MKPTGRALVTGASRGIGRAVAVELHDRGFETIASMRDPADGEGLPAGIRVERIDVTEPDSIRVPSELAVLVNNAGVEGQYLPIEHSDLSQWRAIFETNVFGLVEVTKRAIPSMRRHGAGVICNIGSSSVLAPVPFYGAYRASKAAVSALGETLRAELAQFGIRVLEILPGPVDTDMLAGSDRAPEAGEFEGYRDMAARSHEARRGAESMKVSPEQAAGAIVDAILDDDAALRVGCDPLAIGLIDGWRAASDEDWMRSMLDAVG